MLIKLPSVMCLLVLVDMRWLSLCSFGKAQNVPGVAFTGNSVIYVTCCWMICCQ